MGTGILSPQERGVPWMRLWKQIYVLTPWVIHDHKHTHSHTLTRTRLKQENWESVYMHCSNLVTVKPVLKRSCLVTQRYAYLKCISTIWCLSLEGFFSLFLVGAFETDGAVRGQAVVREHKFFPTCPLVLIWKPTYFSFHFGWTLDLITFHKRALHYISF